MSLKNLNPRTVSGTYKEFNFIVNHIGLGDVQKSPVVIWHSRGTLNPVTEYLTNDWDDDGWKKYNYMTTENIEKEAFDKGFGIEDLDGLTEAIIKVYESLRKNGG